MHELTSVISSVPIGDQDEGRASGMTNSCPRDLLGLRCISDQYDCLCHMIESSTVETVTDENRGKAQLRLSMTYRPNRRDLAAVMLGIDLTGYKAEYQSSSDEIIVTFNLRGPQNLALRIFMNESELRRLTSPVKTEDPS